MTHAIPVDAFKVYHNFSLFRNVLANFDPSCFEHFLGGYSFILGSVLVRHVDDVGDSGLNDQFCAFSTREKRDVHCAVGHVSGYSVEDSIHLGVADVHVLAVQVCPAALAPRELLVTAAYGKTIVAEPDYLVVFVD